MSVIFLVNPYIYIDIHIISYIYTHYIIYIYTHVNPKHFFFHPPSPTAPPSMVPEAVVAPLPAAFAEAPTGHGPTHLNYPYNRWEKHNNELWGMVIPPLGMPFAGHITSYPEWISYYVQNKTTIHPSFHGGMTLPFWWEHTSYFDHGTYKPVGAKGC